MNIFEGKTWAGGLEVEFGKIWYSRTNADSTWNPVYKVFHRIHCGNEPIQVGQYQSKHDIDGMRPTLEQGCGMQMLLVSILFFHKKMLCVADIKI